jgi:hypothetical protein
MANLPGLFRWRRARPRLKTNFNQAGKPAALQQHAERKMRSYQIAETLMKGYF